MKFLLLMLFVSTILAGASCKKQETGQLSNRPPVSRKVQFLLYTDNDFSSNSDIIHFSLSIKRSSNQILWDSALAPMLIKDIPDLAHKLVIEKLVPYSDTSLLKVGFYYSIENVGNSWFIDSFNSGNNFKIVNFNFR